MFLSFLCLFIHQSAASTYVCSFLIYMCCHGKCPCKLVLQLCAYGWCNCAPSLFESLFKTEKNTVKYGMVGGTRRISLLPLQNHGCMAQTWCADKCAVKMKSLLTPFKNADIAGTTNINLWFLKQSKDSSLQILQNLSLFSTSEKPSYEQCSVMITKGWNYLSDPWSWLLCSHSIPLRSVDDPTWTKCIEIRVHGVTVCQSELGPEQAHENIL